MKIRLIAMIVFAWPCGAITRASVPIELELATQQGVQITAPRDWLQLFTSIGIDHVRIRGARSGEAPLAENRGTAERPRYYVLGILTPRNELQLPGRTFGRSDRKAIQDFLDQLAADGVESLTAPRGRFGLTQKELKSAFADLTQPIDFETKGQALRLVVERMQPKLALQMVVDPAASRKLQSAPAVTDELKGMSAGTGLALLLRSGGLVLRPIKERGRPPALRVAPANPQSSARSTLGKEGETDQQEWPIGWEPDAAPVQVAPSLFAELNAEIDGYTLAETLAAIGPRLQVPLLVDHAALAAADIDPAAIQVTLPAMRMTYHRLLNRVLAPARLGTSLRVDEAGRPFVWITR